MAASSQRTENQSQNSSKSKVKWTTAWIITIIALIGVDVVIPIVPTLPHCPATELVDINNATFGQTAGQVTLSVSNTGSTSVKIVQMKVMSSDIPSGATTTLNTSIDIPPNSGPLPLTVTFLGVTFQAGMRYDFTLVTGCGYSINYSAIP